MHPAKPKRHLVMFSDLRLALRLIAKSRAFSALAIVTLAITIGVNSAIFSLLDGALLRPAVSDKPEQVIAIFHGSRDAQRSFRSFSHAEFEALRGANPVFQDVAAVEFSYVSLGREAGLRRSFAFVVSENYFALMGARPVLGRFFVPSETKPNSGERVIVASHALWQREGGSADFIGRTLLVNGQPHVVVGVAPEGFSGVSALLAPDLWLPLGLHAEIAPAFAETRRSSDLADPGNYCLNLMGRMQTGLTSDSAQSRLPALAARLDALGSGDSARSYDLVLARPFGINTRPGDTGPLRLVGFLLLGMSGVVLVIGCLNLANMMLARGVARAPEIALRLALGATRGQIVRQILTESLVLSLIGGGLGLLLSLWSNSFLQNFFAAEFRSFDLTLAARLQPDFRVVAATFGFCLLATIAFGLGPALRAARADLVHDLKGQSGDAAVTGRWNRFFSGRHLLAMAQVALSLAMLFSAGLFVRVVLKEGDLSAPKGFSTDGTAVVQMDFSLARTSEPEALRRALAAAERLRSLPDVRSVGLTSLLPYQSSITTARLTSAEASAPLIPKSPAAGTIGILSSITPGYFESIGVRILRGRDFSEAEARTVDDAPRVCLIDEGMAEKLFPGEEALGRRVRWAESPPFGARDAMEVIGIVKRHSHGLEDRTRPAPGIYLPLAQAFTPTLFLAARGQGTNRTALPALLRHLRAELHAADSELPVLNVLTFQDFLEKNFTLHMMRLGATIFGIFGGIALLLATVGVYGVKAYAVERRTQEIGIRIALGAERGDIFSLIMKQGAQQALAAIALGAVLACFAGQALASVFYQVKAVDPLTLSCSAAILAGASLLACFLPARRATRVSPLTALRSE